MSREIKVNVTHNKPSKEALKNFAKIVLEKYNKIIEEEKHLEEKHLKE